MSGRGIVKDESIEQAFLRLTEEELGTPVSLSEARFLGSFEHFYQDNFSGDTFSTHYVVLGYQLDVGSDLDLSQLPKQQHGSYRWQGVEALLADPDVHLHTKWYFNKEMTK